MMDGVITHSWPLNTSVRRQGNIGGENRALWVFWIQHHHQEGVGVVDGRQGERGVKT